MRRWKSDRGLETRMILTMFLLAVLYLAFLAVLYYLGAGFLTMLAFMGAFMFIQYYYSDKLVLRSMNAKIVSENESPELHQMIDRLCAIADLPKPKIAIVDISVPNAFATGRNQKNSVVAVTTGLMKVLSPAELEAVVGHELTHIKNRDSMILTIASFLSSLASMIVQYAFFFGRGNRDRDSGGIIVIWVVSVLVYAVSYILIRMLSRYREFAADRGAAIITGQPSNLASALIKISGVMPRIPTQDLRKVESNNAFFIIPAVSKSSILKLFSTHPPVEERIAALEKISRELET